MTVKWIGTMVEERVFVVEFTDGDIMGDEDPEDATRRLIAQWQEDEGGKARLESVKEIEVIAKVSDEGIVL